MTSGAPAEAVPTKPIKIQGLLFTAPCPYNEGDTLNAKEAAVMNQTFHENLRNNYAAKIQKVLDEAKVKSVDELTPEQRAELQSQFVGYADAYDFGVRGTREADPVRAQARLLAKEKVKESLKKQGFVLSEVGTDKINSLVEDALERVPKFMEVAAQIVAARNAASQELSVEVSS